METPVPDDAVKAVADALLGDGLWIVVGDAVHRELLRRIPAALAAAAPFIRAQASEETEPRGYRPVWVGGTRPQSGHSHAEPVCAWPGCTTYLTPAQMDAARAAAEREGGAS